MKIRPLLIKCLGMLVLFGLLLGTYWLAIRPGQLHWGATPAEVARDMPGDEVVQQPTFKATRAVTIRGTPEEIWPWLIQMGYGRAGFYGYDLLENLGSPSGLRSADRIIPELQGLAVGDAFPIFPGATMQVQILDPGRTWVLVGGPSFSNMAFTWTLDPLDAGHTRLIMRVQFLHQWNNLLQAGQIAFTEFFDHLAIRKMLLGIKGRVEGSAEPFSVQAIEIASFLVATLEFAATCLLFLVRRPSLPSWLLALLAGGVLIFAVYAYAPLWITALIELSLLFAIVFSSSWRKPRPVLAVMN